MTEGTNTSDNVGRVVNKSRGRIGELLVGLQRCAEEVEYRCDESETNSEERVDPVNF
jgi:hypothetical protein